MSAEDEAICDACPLLDEDGDCDSNRPDCPLTVRDSRRLTMNKEVRGQAIPNRPNGWEYGGNCGTGETQMAYEAGADALIKAGYHQIPELTVISEGENWNIWQASKNKSAPCYLVNEVAQAQLAHTIEELEESHKDIKEETVEGFLDTFDESCAEHEAELEEIINPAWYKLEKVREAIEGVK